MDKVMLFDSPEDRDTWLLDQCTIELLDQIHAECIDQTRRVDTMHLTVRFPDYIPGDFQRILEKHYLLTEEDARKAYVEDVWTFVIAIAFGKLAAETLFEHNFVEKTKQIKKVLHGYIDYIPEYILTRNKASYMRLHTNEAVEVLKSFVVPRINVMYYFDNESPAELTLGTEIERESFDELVELYDVVNVDVVATLNQSAGPLLEYANKEFIYPYRVNPDIQPLAHGSSILTVGIDAATGGPIYFYKTPISWNYA